MRVVLFGSTGMVGQGALRECLADPVVSGVTSVVRRSHGPFRALYIFRPGFIQPLDGIRSRTPLYNKLYPALFPVMLVMKALTPGQITDTRRIGRAMLNIVRGGFPKRILHNPDINTAAGPPHVE